MFLIDDMLQSDTSYTPDEVARTRRNSFLLGSTAGVVGTIATQSVYKIAKKRSQKKKKAKALASKQGALLLDSK